MAMAVVAVAHKAPVVTEAMLAKAAADAVANTHPAHKVRVVPKAMAAAVKVVDARPWATRNRVAMKADLAAAWASALPAPRQVANPIPCAPVSI
jgi:hypothetical protein